MDARTGEREKLKVKKVAFALMRVSEKKKKKTWCLEKVKAGSGFVNGMALCYICVNNENIDVVGADILRHAVYMDVQS